MGKTQIIKFEQNVNNIAIDNTDVLFVRVKDVVFDADARFEVPYSHYAFMIKGGGSGRLYPSGTYPVFDDKKEMKQWKKEGFGVEIVYMPRDTNILIKWGTPERITYRDKRTNRVVSVGARGQFGITISNYEQFFRKVVGARNEFNLNDFQQQFTAEVANNFADCFLRVVDEANLSYDMFDANRKAIGDKIGEILSEEFNRSWGITLRKFIIVGVGITSDSADQGENVLREDERKKKLEEDRAELDREKAERERLDDKRWEREKFLKQLEVQDKANYYDALKYMGGDASGSKSPPKTPDTHCPKCGSEHSPSDKFCPKCGESLSSAPRFCPNCGKSNDSGSSFCSGCGKKLI